MAAPSSNPHFYLYGGPCDGKKHPLSFAPPSAYAVTFDFPDPANPQIIHQHTYTYCPHASAHFKRETWLSSHLSPALFS